jgi:PadR family transcriptional regulator PadR
MSMTDSEHYQKLKLELRRGTLILAVLAELREEHYGYSLRKNLMAKGLEIDEGTLYPLIRRLEKQQLLTSEWREESNRKKRFYILSEIGVSTLAKLTQEWHQVEATLNTILDNENGAGDD